MRFGDVVNNARTNVVDREANGIDKIVGLDNIVSEILKSKNGTRQMNNFRFELILSQNRRFGETSCISEKVAYADFTACTQNILVFETKDENVFYLNLYLFFVD